MKKSDIEDFKCVIQYEEVNICTAVLGVYPGASY